MNKVTKMALLGCGAFLLVNSINNTNKNKKISEQLNKMNMCSNEYYTINEKLDHLTKHTVTHAWESTIQIQRETIDSLLLVEMDLGAKLDSCIIACY